MALKDLPPGVPPEAREPFERLLGEALEVARPAWEAERDRILRGETNPHLAFAVGFEDDRQRKAAELAMLSGFARLVAADVARLVAFAWVLIRDDRVRALALESRGLEPAWRGTHWATIGLRGASFPAKPPGLDEDAFATWALERLADGLGPRNAKRFALASRLSSRELVFYATAELSPAKRPRGSRKPAEPLTATLAELAALYLAARGASSLERTQVEAFPIDVTRHSRRMLSALRGAQPSGDVDAALDRGSKVRVEFRWANGEQLVLDFDEAEDVNPLTQLRQQYGELAVEMLVGLGALMFAQRKRPGEALWVYADDLPWLYSRSDSKDARKRAADVWDKLNRSEMLVHYKTGPALRAPIVAEVATSGTSRRLMLHPALHEGIRRKDGSMGSRWWPVPVGLLERANGTQALITTAGVVAAMFRENSDDGEGLAEIKVDTLARRLGVAMDRKNRHEGRDLERIGEYLDTLKDEGLVADWSWKNEGRMTADSTLTIRPTHTLAAGVGALPHLPPLPETGSDLASWLAGISATQGLSVAQVAERLGATREALQRATKDGERPLSPQLRKRLRGALWALPQKDDDARGL